MKKLSKLGFLPVLLPLALAVVMIVPIMSFASQPAKVELGSTVTFAVLAGSTITNTGPTTITGGLPEGGGNIGVHPGSAITGLASITMSGWTAHVADAVADMAKDDLQLAYDDAAGRPSDSDLTGQDLGNLTLTSGVYSFSTSAQLTGTLTLDAQGDPDAVFIFQIGSTLTTASQSTVNLINSARFCRVFWQVGSSATLGTSSHFAGHIFALASITATTSAEIQGQLLALTGAVTLDTNTITNALCDDSETTTDEPTTDEPTTGVTTTGVTTTGVTTTGVTTTGVTTTGETTGIVTTTAIAGATTAQAGTTTAAQTTATNRTTAKPVSPTTAVNTVKATTARSKTTTAQATVVSPATGSTGTKMLVLFFTSSLILAGAVTVLHKKQS